MTSRADTAGGALLSPAALASLALVVWNDAWLKRHHAGLLSGKLSDVGLCVFLPIFVAAAIEWSAFALGRRVRVNGLACGIAVAYFVAIKVFAEATQLHVAWLSALVPWWHFRAVTDPTDLVALPATWLAWRTMRAASTAQGEAGA